MNDWEFKRLQKLMDAIVSGGSISSKFNQVRSVLKKSSRNAAMKLLTILYLLGVMWNVCISQMFYYSSVPSIFFQEVIKDLLVIIYQFLLQDWGMFTF